MYSPLFRPEKFIEIKNDENIRQNYHLFEPVFMQYYCFVFNATNPKLDDKRVRRALAHLLDLDKAIETVMHGLGDRITGPFHPTKAYYHKGLAPLKFDLEKARSLLAGAGWKDTNNNGIIDKSIDGEQVEMTLSIKNRDRKHYRQGSRRIYEKQCPAGRHRSRYRKPGFQPHPTGFKKAAIRNRTP